MVLPDRHLASVPFVAHLLRGYHSRLLRSHLLVLLLSQMGQDQGVR